MWLMTPYCKALCDEKFSQLEGKGLKFSHTEQSHLLDFLIVWYSILKFWRCRSTLIFLFANNLPKVFPSGPVILKKQSQLPKILRSRVAEPKRCERQIMGPHKNSNPYLKCSTCKLLSVGSANFRLNHPTRFISESGSEKKSSDQQNYAITIFSGATVFLTFWYISNIRYMSEKQ